MTNTMLWVGFNLFVLAMLALDLGVFHKETHEVSVREATTWSVVWISLALVFNVGIYLFMGPDAGLAFLTGYLIEKALSVDNIFVFVLIFSYFKVPKLYQHRVLFWGVLGALVMRAALIAVGATLIARYHWIMYIFGAFLVYTGVKMAFQKTEHMDPKENVMLNFVRRIYPVTDEYQGDKFFVREAGKLMATPLFLVLVMVETSDLIFAVDSIPAIFAVTTNPFLVYTSNVFAILGLRSLYFLLAGVVDKFRFLKLGLAVILSFVGLKMLVVALGIKIPILLSLGIILGVLTISILASLYLPEQEERTRV